MQSWGLSQKPRLRLLLVEGLKRPVLLDCLELLGLGFVGVVAVEGIATADQAVARSGGAIAEGAANGFGREGPLPYRIRQYARVGQHQIGRAHV